MEPTRAVFISYASQDVESARSICDALRSAGIEIWFDQSELRGGDAWDRQIRKQIHDCTLFIPIISANSQARLEGYFRLEWRLAVERTHRMADAKPFLVPVVIDATGDTDAEVPDAFRAVQWSRLPAGTASREFTHRISKLLRHEQPPWAPTNPPAVAAPSHLRSAASTPLIWKRPAIVLIATGALIGVGYVAVDKFVLSTRPASVPVSAPVVKSIIPTQSPFPEKSVAVLPFVDMSEKHDQEYFSEGLSEELIDSLTRISDLRVPARTSSYFFKGKSATVADIASALRVSHILEGSVRSSGNRLRVTVQLVRTDNGYHLWSQTYDRDIGDVFKVQDEIAAAVVAALKVSLLNGESPHATPSANTAAYTVYLQARAMHSNALQLKDELRAIEYLQRALKLDPNFAPAWALLASCRAYAYEYFTSGDYQEVKADAREAAERALTLDSSLVDGYVASAQISYDLDWNWVRAESEIKHALALDPNSTSALVWASTIARVQGRAKQALDFAQKAAALDPLGAWNYGTVANAYLASGDPASAEAAYRQALDLAPTMSQLHFLLGWVLVAADKPTDALDQMEQESDERYREVGRALALDALGRKIEANRALAIAESKYSTVVEYPISVVYANRRDADRAFAWLSLAYQHHDGWIPWTPWNPLLANVKSDPRYKAFLRKMNLPA